MLFASESQPHQAAHQTVPMFCRTACQNPLGLKPRRQQSMPYPQHCFNTEGHGRLGVLSRARSGLKTELNESAHYMATICAGISLPASVTEKSQPHETVRGPAAVVEEPCEAQGLAVPRCSPQVSWFALHPTGFRLLLRC